MARAYFRAAQQLTKKLESLDGGERFHEVLRAAGKGAEGGPRAAFGDAFKAVPRLRADMSIDDLSLLYRERGDSPALVYVLAVLCGEHAMKSFMVAAKEYRGSPHVRRLTAEMHAWQGDVEAAIAEYVSILDMGRAPPPPLRPCSALPGPGAMDCRTGTLQEGAGGFPIRDPGDSRGERLPVASGPRGREPGLSPPTCRGRSDSRMGVAPTRSDRTTVRALRSCGEVA